MESELKQGVLQDGESGWWILAKVALFVAIPGGILFLIKMLIG